MKKILIFSISIFLTFPSFSQIKVVTLMNILKMNYDQFEDFTLKNDWELDEVQNTKFVSGIGYKKGNKLNKEFLTLYKKFYKKNNLVSFQTSNKEKYSYLKNEIKTIGFTLFKTEIVENSINYIYRKKINNDLTLELSIHQIPINYKEKSYGGWEFNLSQIFNLDNFILDTPQ